MRRDPKRGIPYMRLACQHGLQHAHTRCGEEYKTIEAREMAKNGISSGYCH